MFSSSTILNRNLKISTFLDYDRILVLDAGKGECLATYVAPISISLTCVLSTLVAEFDTPKNLIAKEDSIFRGMCIKSGDFDELKEAADRHAEW